MNTVDLLEKWEKRLESFKKRPEIAKSLDENTALSIQHARILTLETCIKELGEIDRFYD
jgi:hypothetical protein